MAFPSDLVRTKNWGTETLTDTDLEGQLDLIINWVMAAFDATSGHDHSGTNKGKLISPATGLVIASQAAGDTLYASSSTVWARLAKGTAGQVLRMNSGATAPEWAGYAVPSGFIGLWSGTIATIPTGWVLCDGNNSTPNLTNRFIVGADADSGGAAKSTITGSALQSSDTGVSPAHDHFVVGDDTSGTALSASNQLSKNNTVGGDTAVALSGTANAATIGKSSSSGTGTKVIAVFYALAYIMKS